MWSAGLFATRCSCTAPRPMRWERRTPLITSGMIRWGSFERRAQEVVAAFREPGALSRTVLHPAGDRSGEELLELRITEFAVHAWDLARAIGANEQIDPLLADEIWKRLSVTGTHLERGGYFDRPTSARNDASPLIRLLHLTGRHP